MKLGALLAAVALAGCGGSADDERLTIYAAASLTDVFERLEPSARFNFAGSDELATQLREGAEADVYAAASPRYPRELHADGIVERPVVFATNRLIVIVPSDNQAQIRALSDLVRPGVRLVIGGEGVPIGDYTRQVLVETGLRGILENVVSEEQDVKGVVGKVRVGEADAGFVYATDARAAGDDVLAIELPVQVPVEYPIAVVRGSDRAKQARAFVRRLLDRAGRRELRAAGFGLP